MFAITYVLTGRYVCYDMDIEDFVNSCCDAASYPKNLLHPSKYEHELTTYSEGLEERKHDLFTTDESEALVNIFEFDESQRRKSDAQILM
jgi:hypothetical protein